MAALSVAAVRWTQPAKKIDDVLMLVYQLTRMRMVVMLHAYRLCLHDSSPYFRLEKNNCLLPFYFSCSLHRMSSSVSPLSFGLFH